MYQDDIYKLTPNQWEWFALDVLFHLGYSVQTGPSEGVDDGLDMIVELENTKYLVSCKHNFKTKKNVGVRAESDIRDRMEQHNCVGFIAFYSTSATTGLKNKLLSLKNRDYELVEIYLDNILDIIPTMRGFILQKYFSRPQELHHQLLQETEYKPLICMKEDCEKDIISQRNIPWSMTGFHHEGNKIYLIYGCKHCVSDDVNYLYWAEISQIRYIEQMLNWRSVVDNIKTENIELSEEFYEHWAYLQEAILQIQIPQGWGRWI
jgi:hypothetical protein